MTPPVKGAQVLKGGGGQRRLSQKPKFVVFFLKPSLRTKYRVLNKFSVQKYWVKRKF